MKSKNDWNTLFVLKNQHKIWNLNFSSSCKVRREWEHLKMLTIVLILFPNKFIIKNIEKDTKRQN